MAKREGSGAGAVVAVLAVVLVLLGGGYAGAYYAAGDTLPRGTTVGGVEVGGLSPARASERLREGLADRVTRPLTVTSGPATEQVDPEAVGLTVDYDASVAAGGGGRSWRPADLWEHWTGGSDLDPVIVVDEALLDSYLDSVDERVARPAVDATLRLTRDGVRTTDARTGVALERQKAAEALVAAFTDGDATAVLPLTAVAPDIDDADVERAVQEVANPALAAPVVLHLGEATVRLRPADYARDVTFEAGADGLEPSVDADALEALVGEQVVSAGQEPVDASIGIVDGEPRIVKAKPGVTYDRDDLVAEFLRLLPRPDGKREGEVTATVTEPEVTTADVRALGITERMSTFTTYFPYAEYRNTNIGRAAEIIDGTILEPGEEFSLNGIVGERTRENGFTEGFIISDGVFKQELGGGVSQVATTTFNAMFFAGLEDVEHKPHSFYIDRYPVGREATVAWPTVDLRFRNDTEHGVLIDTAVTPSTPAAQGSITVSMYGTKKWDISTSTSDRYAYTAPKTRTLSGPDCYPNDGYSGFQVDVYRYFKRPGSDDVVRTEKFHTVYTPSDTVVCKAPKKP